MKRIIKNKFFSVLFIAGALFYLFGDFSRVGSYNRETNSVSNNNFSSFSPRRSHERVIYTCRLGDEEIPAVQISEVTEEDGQVTGTNARAAIGNGIEVKIPGVAAIWDYKSIAARSGDSLIEVAFDPDGALDGYDWILTLADENIYFRSRVRDCTEVSDE